MAAYAANSLFLSVWHAFRSYYLKLESTVKLSKAFRDFIYDFYYFYNLPNNLWVPKASTQSLDLKA